MHRITLQPTGDLQSVARRWRVLEAHADCGVFRSWTFLGCLAEQRFARARLLAVTQDGHDVALALIGAGHGRSWLNETGDARLDCIFVECNGLLAAPEAAAALPAALRAATGRGRLMLSGIDDATLAACREAGSVQLQLSRVAPAVALDTLRGPFLDTLSANARAQIRRSQRLYGPDLQLVRAESLAQAQDFFTDMVALHQTAWQARGHPGAFAPLHMVEFHRALIERAWGVGEADLLRVEAGGRHVGTLYMLIRAGRVANYQSGFAYTADRREKPGLVCHAMAIAHYAAAGARVYDLLAGAERYKLTLADGGETLHWATLHPRWSIGGLVAAASARLRQSPRQH